MNHDLPPEPPEPVDLGFPAPEQPIEAPAPAPAPQRSISTKGRDRVEGARSPSSFYVPAPNSKDSERISVRVDAATLAAAMRVIETRAFGWESFSDFCRWAVFRGVQEAAAALGDEDFSNEIRVLGAIQKRIQQQHREQEFTTGLAQARTQISTLLQQDAHADAYILFCEILADAEALTISRFKHRFIEELKANFPVLEQERLKKEQEQS